MPAPRHGLRRARALLAAALLASALAAASAQPSPGVADDDYLSGQVHVSTAMIVLLAAVIAVFVFIAFFTVYLRHCTGRYDAARSPDAAVPNFDAFISRSRRQRRPRGLDADVIEAFPTMKYAEAKALRVGKAGGALECAVCLSEFEDEERLRLLPKCSHAFHPDCIGEWLASHVTCPVCRCNLDPSNKDTSSDEEQSLPSSIPVASSISSETAVALQDGGPLPVAAVVIYVGTEEEEEERRQEALELQQIGTQRRAMRSRSGRRNVTLARSHSTGHSLAVRLDHDMERFTLRLPEHVRREMVAVSEHISLQLRRGRRAGEGSSRGGRSAPLGRSSSRWQSLLARTFSGKVSFFSASRTVSSDRVAEVSSSSSSRLRGKRVAAVDAAADVPAKGSVRLDRIGGSGSGAKAGAASREVAADEEKAVTQ
ncbi:hypothetical protein HU200_017322 [Digitaria exilis]|uniref:RING-type E3 ubiquitin transferase n=1 Tax=Digitaria exilis TaxID=1010633 RepID=A0A835F683_9POAL|nr:hypothetical protein HU200_017322 [Digitaria exilis]